MPKACGTQSEDSKTRTGDPPPPWDVAGTMGRRKAWRAFSGPATRDDITPGAISSPAKGFH